MTDNTFDNALQTLLKAFRTHEDLRRHKADLPVLARSNFALHQAGMAAYHAAR
ncbi:MAG TPA: hypothetical protein VMM13_02375 [Euzebya sp.]|nr:hypothetical protein [Euzebya sp.]